MIRQSRTPTKKVVLIGDGASGKTCLVGRYTNNKFSDEYLTTVGASFGTKRVTVENHDETEYVMTIWDLAGQPRFNFIRDNYYIGASAAMLVYDITRMDTFMNIENWLDEMDASIGKRIPVVLVANKVDIRKPGCGVDSDIGIEAMKDHNMNAYIETSALTGKNVENAFQRLAENAILPEIERRIIV